MNICFQLRNPLKRSMMDKYKLIETMLIKIASNLKKLSLNFLMNNLTAYQKIHSKGNAVMI
ncbi:unnamed protein product [Paramecium octaurelia]|uniref:Uncharacterized protein n=1 Tax=Paramecium octaurelia TaxID=43137 RepID=A0A8S1UJR1_PAROT|nr:unnamed protein product [Paramecium octaurelia]